jgi:hypothetical protein
MGTSILKIQIENYVQKRKNQQWFEFILLKIIIRKEVKEDPNLGQWKVPLLSGPWKVPLLDGPWKVPLLGSLWKVCNFIKAKNLLESKCLVIKLELNFFLLQIVILIEGQNL